MGTAGSAGDGRVATSAQLNTPRGISVDISGNVYIADQNNHKIRMVNSTGIITTFAGTGAEGSSGDGRAATSAQLFNPIAVSVDISGNVYIADSDNNKIRMVNSTGIITSFAGTGARGDSGDGGAAASAQLASPFGISVGKFGNVYIADTGNRKVRMVTSTGIITTFAGTGAEGSNGDGGAASSAQFTGPWGVYVDISGTVYIADVHKIRMVTSKGIITTFAGMGAQGSGGDGGAATSAQLYNPTGLSVDISGNVYIADTYNSKIRMVNSSGIITTIVGTGAYGSSGDGGAATAAQLNYPYRVSVDISGNVYIADTYNNKIRKVVVQQGRVVSLPTPQTTTLPSKVPTGTLQVNSCLSLLILCPGIIYPASPSECDSILLRWYLDVHIQPLSYSCTGALQTLSVPSNVASVVIDIAGAQGGGSYASSTIGGLGGRVQTTYTVTPGSTLYIYVGCKGTQANGQIGNTAVGGWNGGGIGDDFHSYLNYFGDSGGGGGATDIRIGTSLGMRLVVAGAGGGGHSSNGCTSRGGNGGGLTGASISDRCAWWSGCPEYVYASGGTQLAGGVAGMYPMSTMINLTIINMTCIHINNGHCIYNRCNWIRVFLLGTHQR